MPASLLLVIAVLAPAHATPACERRSPEPEIYCRFVASGDCAASRKLYERAVALADEARRCAGPGCEPEDVARAMGESREIEARWRKTTRNEGLNDVMRCVRAANDGLERTVRLQVARDLARLPKGAGDKELAFWRRLSLEFSNAQLVEGDAYGSRRERVNELARRLAAARDRIAAGRREAGLEDAPPAEGTLAEVPAPRRPGRLPPDAWPDVYGFRRGEFAALPPSPEDSLELTRRFTLVVGDPVGRKALVHQQEGADCTVVAQQQILEESGALPAGGGLAVEKALSDESWRLGQRSSENQQTFQAYGGQLLQQHGMLMASHFGAKKAALDAAVKSGRLVTVDVDGGMLQRAGSGSGHTVVITGGRVDGRGRVLGYYVNDSDYRNPLSGHEPGRYVGAREFLKAWKGAFVEPL